MSDLNTKLVMILEKSSQNLDISQDGNEVILEGIFAQFGVVNNNDRLYEEAEYLPHLEYLNKKISDKRLLGELDHPAQFDISLSKVSHVIESLVYDKQNRQLKGKLRLLDTPSGRIAKNLVQAGVPISVSSRAAGIVESNKKVKIKKIFTYDLVADPGFENAVLTKINESLGITNESIAVYDMTDKYPDLLENTETPSTESSLENENSKTNKQPAMEFVTTEEMNAYSLFVKEEFEKLQKTIETLNESKENNELYVRVDEMSQNVEKMQKYLDYLANTSDKSIQYSEYVAEKLDKVIEYTNYISRTLDESIDYTEHVAEKTDKNIQYSEYLKEQLEKGIAYSEYLKECLEKTVDYTEYVAEKTDHNIQYSEYLAEKADQGISYSEHIAEKMDQAISYSEYLAEGLEKGIAYSEYLAEQSQAVADYVEFSVNESKNPESQTKILESETTQSKNADYTSLPGKVDQLLESINKQKIEQAGEKHFGVMMLLDEKRRTEFRRMDETTKQKVLGALNESSVKTEEDATKVWESVLTPHVEKWIEDAPQEYKQLWESLDDKSRQTLMAQSRTYKLETSYQIKNFWETRPASVLSKSSAQKLNESKETGSLAPNTLGYSDEYIKMVGDLLGSKNRK
jgi:hypothetical protein